MPVTETWSKKYKGDELLLKRRARI